MILGFTWLDKHNPEIDFHARSVKMTRCLPRCCVSCQADHKAEWNARREDTKQINTCRTGPFPAFVEDADEEDKAEQLPNPETDFPDEQLEKGNRIWAAGLFPQAEHIRATTTVSQQLAEGFRQNSQPSEYIPPHLHDFHSVFSKDSFDELPGTKLWDHTVELTPNASPKSCKVYPLSASEQKELDAFLKENLDSGWIRPSKSLMAAPVFFVKKKDRGLCLVQDYCALNAMTVKNKYLLPLVPELIMKLHRAKYFTKLDVRWGFDNVQIKEGDKWKAAF